MPGHTGGLAGLGRGVANGSSSGLSLVRAGAGAQGLGLGSAVAEEAASVRDSVKHGTMVSPARWLAPRTVAGMTLTAGLHGAEVTFTRSTPAALGRPLRPLGALCAVRHTKTGTEAWPWAEVLAPAAVGLTFSTRSGVGAGVKDGDSNRASPAAVLPLPTPPLGGPVECLPEVAGPARNRAGETAASCLRGGDGTITAGRPGPAGAAETRALPGCAPGCAPGWTATGHLRMALPDEPPPAKLPDAELDRYGGGLSPSKTVRFGGGRMHF